MKLNGNGSALALAVAWASGVVAAGAVMGGCALADPLVPTGGAVSVSIPGLPSVYAPMLVVWELTWWDGDSVATRTMPEQRAVDPLTATLALSRQGAEVVVVQAAARVVSGGRLAPLGGWGAPPQSAFTLEPAFGRAAEAVFRVARRGLNPALINLRRLHETVVEECGEQPELLDQERLVRALGSGEMTRYAIRRRARPGCEISLPESGSLPLSAGNAWISNDTTEEIIEGVWADDRCYWIIPVADGEVRHLWQWVSADHADPADHAAPASPTAAADPAADVLPGTGESVPVARLLTVGRDRDGHAFWFISPPR